MRGLTLNLNGSFNDVSYLSYKDAPCPPEVSLRPGAPASCDLSGHQVVGASKWIGNANGEYKWNLSNGLEEYVTASYAFRSKAVGTVEDSDFGQIRVMPWSTYPQACAATSTRASGMCRCG